MGSASTHLTKRTLHRTTPPRYHLPPPPPTPCEVCATTNTPMEVNSNFQRLYDEGGRLMEGVVADFRARVSMDVYYLVSHKDLKILDGHVTHPSIVSEYLYFDIMCSSAR